MLNYRTCEIPKWGEIWLCYLEGRGSVQGGYRPVFILSNNKNNTYSTTINVIPLTSKMSKKLPVHVELWEYEQYGLTAPSTILVEQIMTISSSDLDRRIGSIDNVGILHSIKSALSIQFQLSAIA